MLRTIVLRAASALIVLFGGMLLPMTPAAAEPIGPFGRLYVHIQGYGSGKCVDNPNGSQDNWTTMVIWECHDSKNNQTWNFHDRAGGFYAIENYHSSKCLTVLNASPYDNAPVVQYECSVSGSLTPNAEWQTVYSFTSGNHDYYRIVNRNSNRCLTVKNNLTSNGATLLQFECNNKPNQAWTW